MENSNFLTARWNDLLLLNYEVPPDILKRHLPYKTELDSWNGHYYLSIVGFHFKDARLMGMKFPYNHTFPEVNLRFYVRHKYEGKWRRGVVFIKKNAPNRLIGMAANILYKEQFRIINIKHKLEEKGQSIAIEYSLKHGNKWESVKAECENDESVLPDSAEEKFIIEHYWGYTKVNENKTLEFKVKHPSWKLHKVSAYNSDCDLNWLFGSEFHILSETKPQLVFFAEGSEVVVNRGEYLN